MDDLIAVAAQLEQVTPDKIMAARMRETGELAVVVSPGAKHIWTPEQMARRLEEIELQAARAKTTVDGRRQTAEKKERRSSVRRQRSGA